MATLEELKNVLKETLDKRGVLSQIKAKIRAEIFASLEHEGPGKPKLSQENLLINELIREYMQYNGYLHALSVFTHESGQPSDPILDHDQMARDLRVVEDSSTRSVPLLYSLIYGYQKSRPMGENEIEPERERTKLGTLMRQDEDEPQPMMFKKT
eukprot:TRINITY_DN7753_c0_g1_i14.p2 TRINITY_DN7753_c0_g1~~TRINITY_DN7753_c0_g1_i14.p2  ORF type:complete len:155 (+),score=42.41 TRINITY_DN7753_c0_g1_i14:116-580(+)